MTDPTTTEVIAARLTPRQKEALLWLPEDGSEQQGQFVPEALTSLRDMGLARMDFRLISWATAITPLGRRVRKVMA